MIRIYWFFFPRREKCPLIYEPFMTRNMRKWVTTESMKALTTWVKNEISLCTQNDQKVLIKRFHGLCCVRTLFFIETIAFFPTGEEGRLSLDFEKQLLCLKLNHTQNGRTNQKCGVRRSAMELSERRNDNNWIFIHNCDLQRTLSHFLGISKIYTESGFLRVFPSGWNCKLNHKIWNFQHERVVLSQTSLIKSRRMLSSTETWRVIRTQ